jgi:hypothetical protein
MWLSHGVQLCEACQARKQRQTLFLAKGRVLGETTPGAVAPWLVQSDCTSVAEG